MRSIKNNILKRVFIINLFCILLFSSACSKQKDGIQEEIWNKHAFLLKEDDIFFVSIPENWKYSNGNTVYIPEKEILKDRRWDNRWAYFLFYFGTPYKIPQNMEDFIFADGQIGKKNIIDRSRRPMDDEGQYIGHVLSADEKYMFSVENVCYDIIQEDIQYETLLDHAEQLYGSMMFQKGQIGLPQKKGLKKREKVKFYPRGKLRLEIMIPEGISFEVRNTSLDYSLFFYLDETKENYVQISNDFEGEQRKEIQGLKGRMLTDQTYKETAIYVTYTLKNNNEKMKKISEYDFSSFFRKPIYAKISVLEEDEEMFEIATDIVKTIKFH